MKYSEAEPGDLVWVGAPFEEAYEIRFALVVESYCMPGTSNMAKFTYLRVGRPSGYVTIESQLQYPHEDFEFLTKKE